MMEQKILFDYHYEEEAERYAFFRIPKALFTEPIFRELSDGAKVLYGQLLDLMSLSRKNGWIDEKGRVFIRCGIDKVKQIMNCSSDKAVKMLKELDVSTGVGLIEKVRLGQGKTTQIYVKSFVIMKKSINDQISRAEEMVSETRGYEKQKTGSHNNDILEFGESEFKDSENQYSGILKNGIHEFSKTEIKNCDNQYTSIPKNRLLEFCEAEPINNNINNIDSKNIHSISQVLDDEYENMHEINKYTKVIKQNIDYDILVNGKSINEQELLDEIVTIIIDLVSIKRKTVKIDKIEYPYERVREMFFKINMTHIQYVLDCLNNYKKKITSPEAFIITALYNSVKTINSYYNAKVNHDMFESTINDSQF